MSAAGGASVRQVAPGRWAVGLPWQPAVIAHTFSADDPAEPLLTNGKLTQPGAAAPAVECGDCDSRLVVAGPDTTLLMVVHGRGCPAMARRLASAGRITS
ncbi:MAG TPA: hypothetical protein VMV92_44350 [Streptosporangiaceae bacterium]|nr:hypothetical protein [Streptosporangiaceae bacterium]HVB44870.1 hypothetical protein [Streptosporangiaceae bacterium]